jgi:hypothetical protein
MAMLSAQPNAKGLLSAGNIDLSKRPVVKNPDGSVSTVRSMSFNEDGREILVPTVSPDGQLLDEDQAIDLYHRTGQHLGMFDNPDDATAYAQTLHSQQEQMYAQPQEAPKMDRMQQLSTALVNADKAGDVEAAKTIAAEIIRMRGAQKQPEEQKPTPSGRHLTYEEGLAAMDAEGANGAVGTGMMGALEGVPVIGPYAKSGLQKLSAGISSLIDGESYDTNLKQAQALTDEAQRAHPGINMTGQVAGAVGSMIPLGATGVGARALGIAGPTFRGRLAMSALSGGGISAADTAARGGDVRDVIGSGEIGLGIGAAVPVLGAGISAGLRGVGNTIYPLANSILNPAAEAGRRVGTAVARDAAANPAGVLSAADEAVARQANVPLVNADRGGEVTRALARSVANQSPEARAIINNTADDRFAGQSGRAINFVRRLTGGNADDIAHQEAIRQQARAVNTPAYQAANSAPEAQSIYTPTLQQLMQSPSFRSAVNQVPRRSADRGAVQGFREIGNPFSVNSRGDYVLRQRADGTLVTPSLQFWDQVKRNLDSSISKVRGDRTRTADLEALRGRLVEELDNAVPAYQTARRGAAGFFDAEDALDAGRSFLNTPRSIPEATRAIRGFSPAERRAFETGYASELIDKLKVPGDRTNVINSVFGNQASREQINLVFGPERARQLEAYVRVEGLADRLRGAMGNSTTARQLVEMGLGAGGGAYLTGDWKGAIAGAAAARGARYIGQRADAQVMERMAHLLTTDNPGNLRLAVQQAARNPAYMRALQSLEAVVGAPARGAGPAISSQRQ